MKENDATIPLLLEYKVDKTNRDECNSINFWRALNRIVFNNT